MRGFTDPNQPDETVRSKIEAIVDRSTLIQAFDDVNRLTRPPNDVFYIELQKKKPWFVDFYLNY